jgi:hypothetical protein
LGVNLEENIWVYLCHLIEDTIKDTALSHEKSQWIKIPEGLK